MTVPVRSALAVDLGSRTVGVWAAHRGTVSGPSGDESTAGALMRRGRVVDVDGCISLLTQLVRRVLDAVLAPARLLPALARGILLVGDGALHPGLAPAISGMLRVRVHRAAAPRTAALTGAGLAAMSLLRHPAQTRPLEAK